MLRSFQRITNNDRGATVGEYLLIVVCLSIGAIGSVDSLRAHLEYAFYQAEEMVPPGMGGPKIGIGGGKPGLGAVPIRHRKPGSGTAGAIAGNGSTGGGTLNLPKPKGGRGPK